MEGAKSQQRKGPTRERPLSGEAHSEDSHQRLVCHRINHSPDNSLLLPSPRDPPVQQIRHTGVREQAQGPGMLVVEDKVAHKRRGHEARERQQVREGTDVFAQGRW